MPEPFYGPVSVPVAIRLLRPLVGRLDEVETYIEDVIVRLSPRSPATLLRSLAAFAASCWVRGMMDS